MDRPDTAPSLSTLPSARAQLESPAPPAGSRWRRRALLLAVVAFPALFVRGCVLDTFVIRSDSMAPIFQGTLDGGDHLLVLRTGLDPRALQRWDVVVVDGSVDPTLPAGYGALLKRVAVMPGERAALRSGDLWVSPGPGQPLALARKPDELIRALLVPVHTGTGLATPWIWEGPGTRESLPSGGVRLTAGDEPGHARFAESVSDGMAGVPGEHSVSDTALRLVVGACDATLELQLREGADVFRASLAPAARGGAALQHNLGGRVVASAPDFPGLQAGDVVLAWNVDDGVRVFVNDELLLAWDQPPHDPPPPGGAPRNDPGLVVTGGSVELREVVVLHDLHYTAEGAWAAGGEFGIPPGQVFLLGDNSLRSRDSRYFGPVPEGAVLGRPFARYGPSDRAGWLDRGGGTVTQAASFPDGVQGGDPRGPQPAPQLPVQGAPSMGSSTPTPAVVDGRDLMKAVSAGEPGAFERLVSTYESRIKAAVARHIVDRASVDDLAQEVLLRLYRARDRYEPTARFETFLYRIIFNICVNHTQYSRRRRHMGFRQGAEDDEPGVPLPADESALAPPRELELGERAKLLHLAIGRLPDNQRRALLLSRFEGLAYEEIATVMDTSLQAVKSLLWRARENLRVALVDRLDEVNDSTSGSDHE